MLAVIHTACEALIQAKFELFEPAKNLIFFLRLEFQVTTAFSLLKPVYLNFEKPLNL